MQLTNKLLKLYNKQDKETILALKNILGFKPGKFEFYKSALTHSSYADEVSSNNERLEFLGDAYIGAVVGEYLFKKYPSKDEGYLTEMRSKIVSRQSLNEIAIKMGLQKIVRFNRHDKLLRRSHIFGNALEALVGAIYIDKGFDKTRQFLINNLIKMFVDMEELEVTEYNFKNKLYTWAQRNNKKIEFITLQEKSEGGRKVFQVGIEVDGELVVEANGWNKKQASQQAAFNALEHYGITDDEGLNS